MMTQPIGTSSDLVGISTMVIALVVIRVVAWVWDRLDARFAPVLDSE